MSLDDLTCTSLDRDFYTDYNVGQIVGKLRAALFLYESVHIKDGTIQFPKGRDAHKEYLGKVMSEYGHMLEVRPEVETRVPELIQRKYDRMNRFFNNQDK